MRHSTVFAAALKDPWEHEYNLRREKRRPEYLRAQSGAGKANVVPFLRRRSDQFIGVPRRPAVAVRG